MAGGGMGAAAPTNMGQMGGMPMAGTTPAPSLATPQTAPAPTGELQFGTAGVGTGAVEQPISPIQSPMAQQMQASSQMQNPYARPMQPMYRPQMQSQQMGQYGGLQALLSSLINRYQQPQQRVSQMPQYQNRALGYRPDLSQAQANLGRTATTQAEAQAAAAAKAAAEVTSAAEADDFMRWQRQQYLASKNSYGGGG